MTSSNENIFRVTGHLCGEFTGPRWLPRTKASDPELWCFLSSAPWKNSWVSNRNAGDLRRHRAHYDVIVMTRQSWNFPNEMGKCYCSLRHQVITTLRQRQNGRRFADNTFKRIFLNKNDRISIKISLKFVPKDPINNYPASVQIMAWRRSGDKPLTESMMVSLLTHVCVTWPQWVNSRYIITRDTWVLVFQGEGFQFVYMEKCKYIPMFLQSSSACYRLMAVPLQEWRDIVEWSCYILTISLRLVNHFTRDTPDWHLRGWAIVRSDCTRTYCLDWWWTLWFPIANIEHGTLERNIDFFNNRIRSTGEFK